ARARPRSSPGEAPGPSRMGSGSTRSSAPAPTRSRAAPPRSSGTSSASACSASRKARPMNFGFNDEQELLRSTARKFFENECPSETVRTLMETPEGITAALWTKLAEQGWTGLVLPEAYDGMGLGLVDLVVLMEEMGRSVVPGPYLSTMVAALGL